MVNTNKVPPTPPHATPPPATHPPALPLRAGVVGLGKISSIYLENLTGKFSSAIRVEAVSDIAVERAAAAAKQYGIQRVLDFQALIADPVIDIVLNLTTPENHFSISLQALKAGKHVYSEKPLALKREDAAILLETAAANGVRIGCAPDTFLGAGLQTCRAVIEEGLIGQPTAFFACMMNHGHEHWHPNPAFYYHEGGGPMFDMGPYYITALVHLLGPVRRVSGFVKKTFAERTVESEAKQGMKISVEIPTHIQGSMEFVDGTIGTLITSFDVWAHTLPSIEIYGTLGTLRVPDPNHFGGQVLYSRKRESQISGWKEVPLRFAHEQNSRGLGLAEMAEALAAKQPHLASGDLARHVLDVMHGFHDAAETGRTVELSTTCRQPAPMIPDLLTGKP